MEQTYFQQHRHRIVNYFKFSKCDCLVELKIKSITLDSDHNYNIESEFIIFILLRNIYYDLGTNPDNKTRKIGVFYIPYYHRYLHSVHQVIALCKYAYTQNTSTRLILITRMKMKRNKQF